MRASLARPAAGMAGPPRAPVHSANLARRAVRPAARLPAPRAMEVSGPGSSPSSSDAAAADGAVTAELMATMRSKIAAALETPEARVSVADVSGDGRHVEIDVVAAAFEGKRSMERQRMVYKAIWEELQGDGMVHAVDAMVCRTPVEAGE